MCACNLLHFGRLLNVEMDSGSLNTRPSPRSLLLLRRTNTRAQMSVKHLVSVQGQIVNHSTSFQNPHESSDARLLAVITQVPLCCLGDGVSDYGLLCPNSDFSFTAILILLSEIAMILKEISNCGFKAHRFFMSVFINMNMGVSVTTVALNKIRYHQKFQNYTCIYF